MSRIFNKVTLLTAVLVVICLFAGLKYMDYRLDLIASQIQNTNNSLATKEKIIDNKIKTLGNILSDNLTEEQSENNYLKDKLSSITSTVETLEKLSTTDPELLKKYSKVYFLNEHYVPVSLTDIEEKYRSANASNYKIHSDVYSYLEELMNDAEDEGLGLKALSAYRSFSTQSALKSSNVVIYGAGTANRFSADQGYSEHQLGTTVDFTSLDTSGALVGFEKTPEYKWLQENAHKYGFILSYPAGNIYYKFEPWHWRFVGVNLATKLERDEVYFYNTDQRVIDGYLSELFD